MITMLVGLILILPNLFLVINADVVPAGLCYRLKVDILPIDYEKFVNIPHWNIIYVTESPAFDKVDHSFVQVTPNGDGSYTVDATRVLNDTSSFTHTYTNRYVKNVVVEDTIDYETGKSYQFDNYPLAVTKNMAAYYIRCSQEGGLYEDTRFIAIPKGTTLSDKDLQYFLETDRKYKFQGNLHKLPYKLYKGD